MLRKKFKHSANFFLRKKNGKEAGRDLSAYKANKKPSLHGTVDDFFGRPNEGPPAQDLAAAQTTHGKNTYFSRKCYNIAALQDRIPDRCCRRLWKKHKSASYSAREKSGNSAANIWQKTAGSGLSAYKAHKKRPLSTEPLTTVSADRTVGLLHRILLLRKPRMEKKTHMFPHCATGHLAFASDLCGLWKNRKRAWYSAVGCQKVGTLPRLFGQKKQEGICLLTRQKTSSLCTWNC